MRSDLFYFKKAFTLAEVLITLGIIGIVAAMTIPNLIANYQKNVTVTQLQKAISVLNQAYKSSFDDNGEPASAYALGSEQYFHEYWEPYIKIHTYCTDYQICGYKSQFPFVTPSKSPVAWSVVLPTARATFYTMDGFLYQISTGAGYHADGTIAEDREKVVLVDINGSRKPNRMGHDVFVLQRIPDGGGVQPYGNKSDNESVDNSCSVAGSGWTCAEKIRRAGWKIEKDYPW